MAIPTITMSCNSLPLTAIETAAVNCELDTSVKKFGRGSIKVLQGGYIVYTLPENFDIYSNMWSADFWVYFSDTTAQYNLLNNDNGQNGCFGVSFLSGNFAAYVRGYSGQSITGPEAQQDVWQHVRVTHQGSGTLKYYLNGTFFGTNRFTQNSNVLQTSIAAGSTYWGAGNIDEFALTILDSSNVAEYSGDTAPVPTEGYPDEVRSPGIVIDGLFLSTSKPKANQKGLLVNNKFFIPFAESSGSSGDTSAFESEAMAIIGTPTGGGGESGDEIITLVSESGSQGQSKVAINATGSVIVTNGSASQTYTAFPAEFTLSAGTTTIQGTVTTLNCTTSTLTSIDISLCPTLTSLDCKGNALSALDISNNANLVTLGCNNNGLTMLNIAQNTALKYLAAYSNKFTSDVVNNILAALVSNAKTDGTLDINYQETSAPPTGQGLIDKQTLIDRGWTVTTD